MHWITPTPGNGAGCCALEARARVVCVCVCVCVCVSSRASCAARRLARRSATPPPLRVVRHHPRPSPLLDKQRSQQRRASASHPSAKRDWFRASAKRLVSCAWVGHHLGISASLLSRPPRFRHAAQHVRISQAAHTHTRISRRSATNRFPRSEAVLLVAPGGSALSLLEERSLPRARAHAACERDDARRGRIARGLPATISAEG